MAPPCLSSMPRADVVTGRQPAIPRWSGRQLFVRPVSVIQEPGIWVYKVLARRRGGWHADPATPEPGLAPLVEPPRSSTSTAAGARPTAQYDCC